MNVLSQKDREVSYSDGLYKNKIKILKLTIKSVDKILEDNIKKLDFYFWHVSPTIIVLLFHP